jgi:hypothetical protein
MRPVEVVKATPAQVHVRYKGFDGRFHVNRQNKLSEYSAFFPTWEEGRDFLLEQIESRVDAECKSLAQAEAAREFVKSMTKPEAQP